MNRVPAHNIRRLALSLFALILTAVALPSAAGDQPLPLPEPAGAPNPGPIIIIPLWPTALMPASNETLDVNGNLQWTNIDADKYVLKFKNLRTGEVRKSVKPGICGDYCWTSEATIGLRTTYRDGDMFTWQVIAKFDGGGKFPSAKVKAFFNEVDTPVLEAPSNKTTIYAEDYFSFNWSDSNLVARFVLTIKDTSSGKTVMKVQRDRATFCFMSCSFSFSDAEKLLFIDGRSYEWHIQAISIGGEKAKSAKHTFTWRISYSY